MPPVANDYVVEHLNLQDFSCVHHPSGDAKVGLRRSWITARMIMHENNSPCSSNDSGAEHLARVGNGFIEGANVHQVMTSDAVADIQQQHCEAFHIRVEQWRGGDVLAPIGHSVIWSRAAGKRV